MAGFKAPCPSCDHGVPVQDMKLVGTKIECPKCKYRFKVEAPKDMPATDAKAKGGKDKGKDKDKSKDKGKKPGADAASTEVVVKRKPDRKRLIGIGLGVVAVAVLIVGGMMMFGGSDDPKPTVVAPKPRIPPKVPQKDPDEDSTQKKIPEPPKEKPPEPKLERSTANATNLLPGDTRAVVRADMDRVRRTPLYNIVVNNANSAVLEVLTSALGLEPEKLGVYFQAYVDTARLPFGIVRLKDPISEKDALAKMALTKGPNSPIQGREYHTLKPNAAQDALGKLLCVEALLGTRPAPASDKPEPARPLAVCVYDTQTIFLADQGVLETFLKDLGSNGYPAHKTEYMKSSGPAPKADVKAPGAAPRLDVSMNPDFLTIDPDLKVILNDLETGQEGFPVLLLTARLEPNQRELDPASYTTDARPWAAAASAALANTSTVGLALRSLSEKETAFQLVMEMTSGDVARTLKEQVGPLVTTAAIGLEKLLGHRVELEGFGEPAPMPAVPVGGEGAVLAPVPVAGAMGSDLTLPLGPSKLSMSIADTLVNITGTVHFTIQSYSQHLWPRMNLFGDQFRGQMLILSGATGRKTLAPAISQLAGKGEFPRGAAERLPKTNRFGLEYPPATRVSFFHELLPFLGKGDVAGSIDSRRAWYDPQNLPGAQAWVPEFLVPAFPASSWRASSPYAEGRALGATNIVALSGRGRDAARYSPFDPARAKDLGITGYDWGSKMSEITDGASNTIYMIQVPPTYSRPWIAGGGATVMGIDDTRPDPAMEFCSPREGRNGTYALMADGSVRWVPANITKEIFIGMATRAGGETLSDLDKLAPKDNGNVAELKTTAEKK